MQKGIKNIVLHTGRTIPQIGYGTYQLRNKECVDGTTLALKLGYRHIDTASIYRNEAQIREAIAGSGLKRQEIYITSKLSPAESGYAKAIQGCQKILERLGISYLDLLLIHWPGIQGQSPSDPINAQTRLQTWRAMVELKKNGKVKDIGVSNFLKHHLEHLLKHSSQVPTVNQFELHPMLWEKDTIEFCRKHNIAIEAYSPLARNLPDLMKNSIVVKIANQHKKTPAQVCLRWSLQHGFIILPKSKTPQYIQDNINILEFSLSEEEMSELDSLTNKRVHTCWDPNSIIN